MRLPEGSRSGRDGEKTRIENLLGDVFGKGVAASILMAQLYALFRSLTGMSLPLCQIVTQVNRFFCECALAGQCATLGLF
jgi:serine phosphatase RsbU (regulator of sigma subunit)